MERTGVRVLVQAFPLAVFLLLRYYMRMTHEQRAPHEPVQQVEEKVITQAAPAKGGFTTLSMPITIIIGAIIIAGTIYLTRAPSAAPKNDVQGEQNAPLNISIRPASAQDHIIGSPNAPIVLVEYSDFQCPFCSLIFPTLKKIVADSNGQIAWVYRNLPLPPTMHPNARPAAEAAECVAAELGNSAYWKFIDTVFTHQQSIGDAFYHKTAVALGADPTAFDACTEKQTYDARIVADETEAGNNGGSGTPYTIIVGKKGAPVPFSGALPEAQILAKIKQVQVRQ